MPKVPNENLNHPLAVLADRIAAEAHAGQPIDHTLRMARLVASLDSVDVVDVAAAMLHDVLEDTALTAAGLGDLLLAGGGDPDAVTTVVALVRELTSPFRPASGLRRAEKQAKLREKLGTISERGQRLKLCDYLDTLVGGEPVPHDLAGYLAECSLAVDVCGLADPILAGWLLCEINAVEREINES